MNHLARAVVDALAFLELSPDAKVDPDAAADAMESIVAILRECTPEERQALEEAVLAESNRRNESEAPEEEIDFFENFFDDFGI